MSLPPSVFVESGPPLVERALAPFRRFARTASGGGLVLLACTAIALAWANSPWASSYHHLWESEVALAIGGWSVRSTLHHLINDGLMAVFFFLVGLEIKREVLAGELASLSSAALPLAAAAGGMIVPAALYAAVNVGREGMSGWGVPMATDIAFALGVLALLGDRIPGALRVFLAALAIVDDIGAVLVIAIFYSGGVAPEPILAALVLLAIAAGANVIGVRSPLVYGLIGIVLWGAVLASGVHATIAGVLLAMTIPARTRIDEKAFLTGARRTLEDFDAAHEPDGNPLTNHAHQSAIHELQELSDHAQTPLNRLEHGLHGIVAFAIIPLFALANAGVSLGGDAAAALTSSVTIGVLLGLVVGKPLGVTLAAWAIVRLGLARLPAGVSWRAIHGAAWLAGIGFTMSIFIAGLAFPGSPELLTAAKLGILGASAIAGIGGWLLLRGVGRPASP
ncbi:MAG TPA: Na+/H+ antiporter NhaA [Gemmatimonadaceae bacterium]